MTLGTYAFEVDFANDGAYSGNDDITAFLVMLDCVRGRDRASQLTGRSTAGRLTARLNNTSGRFSSFNAASPLYGNLRPGRAVRLRMTTPTAATLWTGRLDRIIPAPAINRIPTAELVAFGPLARLQQARVDAAMSTAVLTGTAIGSILDAVGWATTTNDRRLDAGQLSMTRWWADNQVAIAALRDIEDSEIGFLYEGASGHFVFQDRTARLRSPYTVSQVTLSDAAGATARYAQAEQRDPLAEIYNFMEATIRLYSSGGSTTLWTHPESTAGSLSPQLATGETKTFWARYPNPAVPTSAVAVDVWTTPTTADYSANDQANGGGADRTANISLAVTKYATRMRIDVTNNFASTVFLTRLAARGIPLTGSDPVQIIQQDSATSQAIYGLRRFANPGPWLGDSSYAANWGLFNLGIYKDPLPFLALTIRANRDNSHLTQVATREVSDRITVVATGDAGLGISQDFFIESIRHRLSRAGAEHLTTWELSPVDPGYGGGYWTLDVSKLDTESRLAF